MYFAIWNEKPVKIVDISDMMKQIITKTEEALHGGAPKVFIVEKTKELLKADHIFECSTHEEVIQKLSEVKAHGELLDS